MCLSKEANALSYYQFYNFLIKELIQKQISFISTLNLPIRLSSSSIELKKDHRVLGRMVEWTTQTSVSGTQIPHGAQGS